MKTARGSDVRRFAPPWSNVEPDRLDSMALRGRRSATECPPIGEFRELICHSQVSSSVQCLFFESVVLDGAGNGGGIVLVTFPLKPARIHETLSTFPA